MLEDLHADRLIVHERARTPVGELHTPQDQFILDGNVIGSKQRPRRMVACDIESGRHLPLVEALPDKRLVASAAQSQRECIEQNRLSRAGLASKHGKAAREIDVEPLDQNNVANGQSGEHRNPGPGDSPSLKTRKAGTRLVPGRPSRCESIILRGFSPDRSP